MARRTVDNLIEELYCSNDPLCFEAAYELGQYKKEVEHSMRKLSQISLAAKYMLESLMEINSLAKEKDVVDPSMSSKERDEAKMRELGLRLQECSNIATDTINLKSVKRAYERMYYE